MPGIDLFADNIFASIYEDHFLFVVTLNNTIVLSNFCPGNTTVHMDEQQGRTPALKKLHRTIR